MPAGLKEQGGGQHGRSRRNTGREGGDEAQEVTGDPTMRGPHHEGPRRLELRETESHGRL